MAWGMRIQGIRAVWIGVCFAFVSTSGAQEFIGTRVESLEQSLQPELMGVESVALSDNWNAHVERVPNLGLSDEVKWIRIILDSRTENGMLIEIQNAGIDELTGYMICDEKVVASFERGGIATSQSESSLGTYPTFPIPLTECYFD